MTRTFFLTAAILACLPLCAMGQTKKTTAQASAPCCGQVVAAEDSPAQMRLQTQQNLQAILLMDSGGRKLVAGDYLISESFDGCEFRALVNRQGVVDAWYVADLDGMPMMLMKNTGGGTTTGINYCFVKYSRDISNCAYLEKNWPNRYTLCINAAWDSLWGCIGGINGGVIMR